MATDGGEGVQFREREGGNETMTMMVMAKMADDDRLQIAERERREADSRQKENRAVQRCVYRAVSFH